jgi:hypothetical protein
MILEIRDYDRSYLPALLAMNNASAPVIVPLSSDEMEQLAAMACYFRVAFYHGEVAGLIVALDKGQDYSSPNYRWFCDHLEDFVYIDRVVVDQRFRGHGIGKVFYADVQSFAENRTERLACEVAIEPRNDLSLLFHGMLGFQEVGQLTIGKGKVRVSLLEKSLPSFEYIKQNDLVEPMHEPR